VNMGATTDYYSAFSARPFCIFRQILFGRIIECKMAKNATTEAEVWTSWKAKRLYNVVGACKIDTP